MALSLCLANTPRCPRAWDWGHRKETHSIGCAPQLLRPQLGWALTLDPVLHSDLGTKSKGATPMGTAQRLRVDT